MFRSEEIQPADAEEWRRRQTISGCGTPEILKGGEPADRRRDDVIGDQQEGADDGDHLRAMPHARIDAAAVRVMLADRHVVHADQRGEHAHGGDEPEGGVARDGEGEAHHVGFARAPVSVENGGGAPGIEVARAFGTGSDHADLVRQAQPVGAGGTYRSKTAGSEADPAGSGKTAPQRRPCSGKSDRNGEKALATPSRVHTVSTSLFFVMSYAVIKTGGKQYRVTTGDVIDVENLGGDAGVTTTFSEILFFHDGSKSRLGKDLEKVSVSAEVVEHFKGKKVIAYKYRRRKGYHRTVGHRRQLTRLKITGITA